MKKTLVLGASPKSSQYSHMAIQKLLTAGHPVEAIGRSTFELDGVHVKTEKENFNDIDTVTMYLNSERQKEYEEYIIALNPMRIIFNPGAENHAFAEKARGRN
ncbi:MAG: CoA-binding protein [Chitinophagaceae bacterium]|nr:CoA-binding protein [Chitinophagaceae bacterium]MCE2758074.1 CoA-binding protein [Chitinophagaceae bacterium]